MELDFGLTKIIKANLNDEHEILTISTFLNGEYGKHDISIGVPAIVNSKGVQEILQIELTKEEQEKFDHSYEILNDLKNKIIL